MAPGAYWKCSTPSSLSFRARSRFTPRRSSAGKIHQLDKETGNRIRYRKVDAETGDDVEQANIIKGYELAKRICRRDARRTRGRGCLLVLSRPGFRRNIRPRKRQRVHMASIKRRARSSQLARGKKPCSTNTEGLMSGRILHVLEAEDRLSTSTCSAHHLRSARGEQSNRTLIPRADARHRAQIVKHPGHRVVIVTGAGKAFSAGGDFEMIPDHRPAARMTTWKEA